MWLRVVLAFIVALFIMASGLGLANPLELLSQGGILASIPVVFVIIVAAGLFTHFAKPGQVRRRRKRQDEPQDDAVL